MYEMKEYTGDQKFSDILPKTRCTMSRRLEMYFKTYIYILLYKGRETAFLF